MKKYLFALLTALFLLNAFGVNIQAQNKSLPALTGDDAIEQLKEAGSYDSLMEAVEDAQHASDGVMPPADWTEEGRTTSNDGRAQDNFGHSVAVSGNTSVIGAFAHDVNSVENQGAVYVYVNTGAAWTLQQKLTANDGGFREWFGYSVAIEGDTIIVGAIYDDILHSQQGSAYVFVRSGTTWMQQAKLIASDAEATDLFGYSVDISGNTAIIGARYDNAELANNAGSAYIFVRNGTDWTEERKLMASNGRENDEFGFSVAIDGNTAVIGAPYSDGDDILNRGAIYVFTRGEGVWSQQRQIFAADGAEADYFGVSVAFHHGTIVVGSYGDDDEGKYDQGSAYVFSGAGASWEQQAKLLASGGEAGDAFGISVAVNDDTIVVGADYDEVGTNYQQGSAYVFKRAGGAWQQQKQLNGTGGSDSDSFGASVAVSGGGKIVVGAPYVNVNAAFRNGGEGGETDLGPNQGAAYFFSASAEQNPVAVSISGEVIAPQISSNFETITLTDSQGNQRVTVVGKRGQYRFDNVMTGRTYTLRITSCYYAYPTKIVALTADTMVNFTAESVKRCRQ